MVSTFLSIFILYLFVDTYKFFLVHILSKLKIHIGVTKHSKHNNRIIELPRLTIKTNIIKSK